MVFLFYYDFSWCNIALALPGKEGGQESGFNVFAEHKWDMGIVHSATSICEIPAQF